MGWQCLNVKYLNAHKLFFMFAAAKQVKWFLKVTKTVLVSSVALQTKKFASFFLHDISMRTKNSRKIIEKYKDFQKYS
jgi:hypothetical protein